MINTAISIRDQSSKTFKVTINNFNQFQEQVNHAKKSTIEVGKSIENVGKNLTTHVSKPLLNLGTFALKASIDFTDGMAKVGTIADTTKVPLDKLRKGILDLSDKTGVGAKDLAEAEYHVLSAGVDTANSVKFLETAVKSAKGGYTDTKTAIDSLTTVLDGYGMKAEEVSKISDQMMLTQKFGKIQFGELGQSIGNVIPTAANLGVSTKELFGSLAVLTKHGMKTNEAVSGLNSAYRNVLNPSKQASKLASQLGLNFNSAHLKSVGWAKFLDEIKQKTGGNSEKMAQLFGSTEAFNSVMLLTGKGAKDFNKVLKDMDKCSGLTNEAFEKAQTPGEKFRKILNKINNVAIKLGDSLTPILETLTDYISKISDKLSKLTPAQMQLITKFILIAATIGPVVLGIVKLSKGVENTISTFNNLSKTISEAGGFMKFLTTPGMKVVLVMVAIALVALFVIKNWSKIKACFKNAAKAISQVTGISKEDIQKFGAFIGRFLKIIGGKLKGAFSGLGKQILPPLKKLFTTLKKLFIALKPILMPILKFIVGVFVLRICRSLSIIATVASAVIKTIGAVIGGLITILNGVINFIIGIFTGNWKRSWNGIKSILSGVMKILHGLWEGFIDWITAPVQAVVDILDGAFKNKVKWIKETWENLKEFFKHPIKGTVDLIKGSQKAKAGKTEGNALGTSYWHGGETWVGEHGPEKVWLPSGSKITDHRNSMKNGNSSIGIAKLADTIVVREDADIDKIANALVMKLQKTSYNMA